LEPVFFASRTRTPAQILAALAAIPVGKDPFFLF
jgi:hypothetical protein